MPPEPHQRDARNPEHRRPRWSIRNLLVATAAAAVVVQTALLVDIRYYLHWTFSNIPRAPKDAVLIYLNAILPHAVLFAPWSRIMRFSLLGVLLAVYWFAWLLGNGGFAWWGPLVPTLAWSTFMICGILWLHGYRIRRDRPTAGAS